VNGRVRLDNPTQNAIVRQRTGAKLRALNTGLIIGKSGHGCGRKFSKSKVSAQANTVPVASSVPMEYYVKEFHFGGFDLMTQTIRVTENSPPVGTLEVVLSSRNFANRWDRHGSPQISRRPVCRSFWCRIANREHTELFKAVHDRSVRTLHDSQHPPGRLQIVLRGRFWNRLPYFDPDLLKKFGIAGQGSWHVVESSKLNIEIPWIRVTQ
jgi:hypothetical protein